MSTARVAEYGRVRLLCVDDAAEDIAAYSAQSAALHVVAVVAPGGSQTAGVEP
jgi:hypothetical protein